MKVALLILTIVYLIAFGARLQRISVPPKIENNNWQLSDTLVFLFVFGCIIGMWFEW
jgi:hypothetical protein